ncbi:MAG: hypothetical protein ACYCSA_02705 [Thermoplasmataceae archaeon]
MKTVMMIIMKKSNEIEISKLLWPFSNDVQIIPISKSVRQTTYNSTEPLPSFYDLTGIINSIGKTCSKFEPGLLGVGPSPEATKQEIRVS